MIWCFNLVKSEHVLHGGRVIRVLENERLADLKGAYYAPLREGYNYNCMSYTFVIFLGGLFSWLKSVCILYNGPHGGPTWVPAHERAKKRSEGNDSSSKTTGRSLKIEEKT